MYTRKSPFASEMELKKKRKKKFSRRRGHSSGVVSFASSVFLTMANRWLKPEVYPLFAALGVAVGICGMQLVRNICINPEVRVSKQNRAAGVLENYAEGEKYSEHMLRKYVRNKKPQIMPSVNNFFSDPDLPSHK